MAPQNKIPLGETHPEIAAQWHPTKNGQLTPADVLSGTHKKAWWKCPEGDDHEWVASVKSRTSQGSGCACCTGKQVSVTNSLATLYPEIAAQWHPAKNGELTPADVVAGSNKKYWWKCSDADDHVWEATLNDRVCKGSGCPCCSGHQVSVTNSLATLDPDRAAQWHPTKNGELTPADIVAGSHKKYWWKCPEGEDHEWEAAPRKDGCPFCHGLRVSVTNSLETKFPEIAAEWHPTKNGELTPADVVAGSHKKFWWKCPDADDHVWEATLNNRVCKGNGCACCAGYKVSVTNSLATLYPEIAAQWHPAKNGELTPAEVVAGSNKKYWWKCPEGEDHEWEANLSSRTRIGSGCPFCGHPSDFDAVYIWRLKEFPESRGRICYKVGLTSQRLGTNRIDHVSRKGPYTAVDIRLFAVEDAMKIEAVLKTIGEWSQLTGFDGATECRLFTPQQYDQALDICRDAGTEIELDEKPEAGAKDAAP